jgi:hypothetical protein
VHNATNGTRVVCASQEAAECQLTSTDPDGVHCVGSGDTWEIIRQSGAGVGSGKVTRRKVTAHAAEVCHLEELQDQLDAIPSCQIRCVTQ